MTSTIPEQNSGRKNGFPNSTWPVKPRISDTPITARLFVDDEVSLEHDAARRGVSYATVLREIVRAHYTKSHGQ